jgi:hypothetical protein
LIWAPREADGGVGEVAAATGEAGGADTTTAVVAPGFPGPGEDERGGNDEEGGVGVGDLDAFGDAPCVSSAPPGQENSTMKSLPAASDDLGSGEAQS